ncbi:hypothetical protein Aperf_G00000110567 [Anoplocephala perfoliata]
MNTRIEVLAEQIAKAFTRTKASFPFLDGGFEPITPVLHDLTLQSLILDLKDIEDNKYEFANGRKFELRDKDKLWKELRNEHIADVSSLISRLQAFAESKKQFLASRKRAREIASSSGSLRGSIESIDGACTSSSGVVNYGAELPPDGSSKAREHCHSMVASDHGPRNAQYRKEAASYNALVSVTEYCLSACRENINTICAVEQETVLIPFRDIMGSNVEKLLDYARLSLTYKSPVAAMSPINCPHCLSTSKNLSYLQTSIQWTGASESIFMLWDGSLDSPLFRGLSSISKAPPFIRYYLPTNGRRLHDVDENFYAISQWVPYLNDLLKTPDQTADVDMRGPSARFRTPSPAPPPESGPGVEIGGMKPQVPTSSNPRGHQRSGRGLVGASDDKIFGQSRMSDHCGPRLIVFLFGGATWSETRCVETRLAASEKSTFLMSAAPVKGKGHLGKHIRRSGGISTDQQQRVLQNGGGTGWNWEVILGDTGTLMPKQFIINLKNLADTNISVVEETGSPRWSTLTPHLNPSNVNL